MIAILEWTLCNVQQNIEQLKSHLRGTHYGSNEGVIEAVNEYFGDQEKAFYFEGMRKLEQRWPKCFALKGDYIEK